MSDPSTSQVEDNISYLPTEILHNIYEYFPPSFLYSNVRPVCKKFATILSQDTYFRVRFEKKYMADRTQFPLLHFYGLNSEPNFRSGNIDWLDFCVRFDARANLFQGTQNLETTKFNSPHTSTIDSVHLMDNGRHVVSGGREGLICLWEVEAANNAEPCTFIKNAHTSWIWNIDSHEANTFFSAGFDNSVASWAITPTNISILRRFSTREAAMCLSTARGLLSVGLGNGGIALFDPRIARENVHRINHAHRGTVTDVQIYKNTILSVGEDYKLAIYDLRAHRTIPWHPNCRMNGCPTSIDVNNDLIYVGDLNGSIKAFDGHFLTRMTINMGRQSAINSFVAELEGLIIGTKFSGLKIVAPCDPVKVFAEMDLGGEITCVHKRKKIVAVACSDITKGIQVLKL